MPDKAYNIKLNAQAGDTSAVPRVAKDFRELDAAATAANDAITAGDGKRAEKALQRIQSATKNLRKETEKTTAASKEAAKFRQDAIDHLSRLEKGTAQVSSEMKKGGKAGRNMGLGILEVSRGIEDLQYGIRGVLNNIPQMVLMFGGGAGLAGVISLAAVGVSQLVTHLGGANEELDKAAEKAKEAQEAFRGFLDERAGRRAEAAVARLNDSFAESVRLLDLQAQKTQQQRSLEEARIDAARRLATAQREAARAQLLATQPDSAERRAALAALDAEEARDQSAQSLSGFDNQVTTARDAVDQAKARRDAVAGSLGEAQDLNARAGGRLDQLLEVAQVLNPVFDELENPTSFKDPRSRMQKLLSLESPFSRSREKRKNAAEFAQNQANLKRIAEGLGFRDRESLGRAIASAKKAARQSGRAVAQGESALRNSFGRVDSAEAALAAAQERAEFERKSAIELGAVQARSRDSQELGAARSGFSRGVGNFAGEVPGLAGLLGDRVSDDQQSQQFIQLLRSFISGDAQIQTAVQELADELQRRERRIQELEEKVRGVIANERG